VVEQRKQYGVLLPHFGEHASRERIVDSARRIEAYGFDSVWVRDHLVFQPHHSENSDRTFLDPFVVLSAVAVVTERLILAAGSFIPHRNPVHTALLFGSLDLLAGPNRILAGWGLGSFDHEFQAAGMAGWDRREILREQVEIMRQLWTGREVSHEGQYYRFERVQIQPVPTGGSVPIWYCGSSPAAVRRAVEYCDGWIPARMPRRDYRKRMERMRELAEQAGKPVPRAGTIPYLSPGRSMEEAVRAVNVPATLDEANRRYSLPNSTRLQTIDDLDGATIVGPPEKIIEEVRKHQAVGGLHFVFDMRLRFDDWEECLQLIGEEVLPELRRGD
jgi:probable F420-dependent oxidoreductase